MDEHVIGDVHVSVNMWAILAQIFAQAHNTQHHMKFHRRMNFCSLLTPAEPIV